MVPEVHGGGITANKVKVTGVAEGIMMKVYDLVCESPRNHLRKE